MVLVHKPYGKLLQLQLKKCLVQFLDLGGMRSLLASARLRSFCQMSDWFTDAHTDQWMQYAEPQAHLRV